MISQRQLAVFSWGVITSLSGSAFFFWVWYERYLSIEFNELGRYYDTENQVVYTNSGFVWCLPAFGLFAIAVAQIAYRIWRRRANYDSTKALAAITDRDAINEVEAEARENLVSLVKSMLNGSITYFEGASKVLELKNKIGGISDQDKDFDTFLIIQSETDHLPLEKQKHLWSREALVKLQPEFIKTECWAETFAQKACKNLVDRFGNGR